MKPANKQFLDNHIDLFMVWERAFYVRNLGGANRENMQRIISEEWQPGYSADLWCDACVGEMITKLMRHYNDWLRSQTNDVTVYKDLTEGIVEMNKKLIVKTGFPSNK